MILPGELTAEQLHRALERGPARGDSLHVSGYDSTVSIARLLTARPHVASIEVSTPFELELVRSMNLRELRLRGPESDVVLFLEENQFPTLRSLAALHREYWRRPAGSTWVDLPPALGSGRFPRLENLEVSGVVKPRLIVRLAQTSVAQQLKTLRLEAAFDLNTVDALAEARPFFPRLERLHLVGHSSPFPRVDRRELERRFAGVRVTVEHR